MTATPADIGKNIDIGVICLLDLLKVAAAINPEVAVAAPYISMFINYQAHHIKAGVADGSIVPDDHGGLVPVTNSHYVTIVPVTY
jgi:hypothetical protein